MLFYFAMTKDSEGKPREKALEFAKKSNPDHKKQRGMLNIIKGVYHGDIIKSLYFETQLRKSGLLSDLEQIGVIPIVENPNPYDPELDEGKNEKWALEHPIETETFEEAFEKKDKILRILLIGSIISLLNEEIMNFFGNE